MVIQVSSQLIKPTPLLIYSKHDDIRVTFVWVKIQLVYSICWAKLGDQGPKAPSQGAKPPM